MKDFALIGQLLIGIYGEEIASEVTVKISELIEKWGIAPAFPEWVDENDLIFITYGDGIQSKNDAPLNVLKRFADEYLRGIVSGIHLLPVYPYTSDDGFSVVDYYKIDTALGDWDGLRALGENFDLMMDAVINHVSKSSTWFQEYLAGNDIYRNYFIEGNPDADYSSVVRPRTSPLFTHFTSPDGDKYVWTTFSEDQIDLNYHNPATLLDVLDVLIYYTRQGARYLRLDAIGYLWKELESTCIHLEQTHLVVRLMRAVLNITSPGVLLITETNVPHKENISYFGEGNEANMVYQFPLPPLVLFTFLSGDSRKFSKWLESLESMPKGTTYFNFLASHDGIGMRPIEGLLDESEQALVVTACKRSGGEISYYSMPDGSQKVYEVNISYNDALLPPEADDSIRAKAILAAHALLLSIPGVPAIYCHTMLGSRNDYRGLRESGINRRINRGKLSYEQLVTELNTPGNLRQRVYAGIKQLIHARRCCKAFAPNADMVVESVDTRLVTLRRIDRTTSVEVYICINVTGNDVPFFLEKQGHDILHDRKWEKGAVTLTPYQVVWIIFEEEV